MTDSGGDEIEDLDEVADTLSRVNVFGLMTLAEVREIAALGRCRRYPAGVTLFRTGEPADCLYVVLEGAVRISRESNHNAELELARLGPGEFFGELALIDGGARSATATTLTPARLFLLYRAEVASLIEHATTPSRMLIEMSRRLRDTTERLFREELEKRERIAEAEIARQRSIAQMVMGVAHEMNTPLGTCTTAASLINDLLESANPQALQTVPALACMVHDLRRAASLLTGNLERAADLVRSFSEISGCQSQGDLVSTTLTEAVADALILFRNRPAVQAREIAVLAPPDKLNTSWSGSREHLLRVLLHLLDNAFAHGYPPPQSGRVEVRIDRGRLGPAPALMLEVRDFGRGMDDAGRSRAFEAFYTTARGRGHKGLGLTIVHNIVTGPLGGQVALASTPDQGTTVTLTLPRRRDLQSYC